MRPQVLPPGPGNATGVRGCMCVCACTCTYVCIWVPFQPRTAFLGYQYTLNLGFPLKYTFHFPSLLVSIMRWTVSPWILVLKS